MVIKAKNIENNNPDKQLNKELIDGFVNLIKQIEYDIDHSSTKTEKLKNMFRLKHIKHAVKVISLFPDKITSSSQLKDKKGIGKGIMARIDELLQTGKLGEITVTHKSDKYLSYVNDLEQVYGIGRAKALELITQHNIKSVKELKDALKKNKIILSDNILIGLKYYGIYKQQIPRSEMLEYDTILYDQLHKVDPRLVGVICGSYRRLAKESNDIDFLIVHPKINSTNFYSHSAKNNYLFDFVNKLIKNKIIVDNLTDPNTLTKFMGFCKLPNKEIRRIDIRFMPYDSYYTSLLYFTGSGEFNRKMRSIAIQMNYKLNEYGLYKIDPDIQRGKNEVDESLEAIKITSEKDVFEYLGMEYLEPELRK